MKTKKARAQRKVTPASKQSLKLKYEEITPVVIAFQDWVERMGGRQARQVLGSIQMAEIVEREYRSIDAEVMDRMLNKVQKNFARQARRDLLAAQIWLAAQAQKGATAVRPAVPSRRRGTTKIASRGKK